MTGLRHFVKKNCFLIVTSGWEYYFKKRRAKILIA